MKAKSITFMLLTLILVLAITFVSLFGINLFGREYYKGILKEGGMNLGIDLAGGSTITFEADKADVTVDEMDIVEAVISARLTGAGYTEAKIIRSKTSDIGRIRVEIPSITNTDEAIALLGSVAKLTFTNAAGEEVLTGSDVKDAKYAYGPVGDSGTSQHHVVVEFTDEGAGKFSSATAAAVGSYISINIDGISVSQPTVKQQITGSSCTISGNFDRAGAKTLANQIKSGNLPVALNVVESSTVGPELGANALSTSLLAALIGIIIIMLFMIIIYRLPGLVAAIALVGYTGIICLILGLTPINLSLSGIAGIVLSIGMAVDANVIIFERIKEEVKIGKTIRASVDAGFHRALSAIIDANITTVITSVVLLCSGVASVQGFALTLLIGVILSMFTAITLTRFLLKQIVNLNVKNPKLYGA